MGQQLLSLETSKTNPRIGEQITVDIFHQVQREDNESGAIKLGLSFFFNDNELQLDSINYPSDSFRNSLETTVDDSNNDDGKDETNKRSVISFQQAPLNSPYPDERTVIAQANFTVLENFDGTEVAVKIPSATAQTYNNAPDAVFEAKSLPLELGTEVPTPPQITINDLSLAEGNEGNTAFEFRVTLSEASNETVTVDYSTADGTAVDGEDYTGVTGTLEFAPGEPLNKTITVQITGDTTPEEDQTFTINLTNPSNAEISDNQGIGTILNDDDLTTPLDININRFQNSDVPGTYLFAGEEESQNIRENFPNFVEEGLAFKVADEPGDDLIPLYRFQSLITPGTYLFAGEAESEGIRQNFSESFVEEGLAFYVYGVGAGKGTEFTRFQNSGLPGTYLFAGPEESEGIRNNFPGFIEEGAAFEVGT